MTNSECPEVDEVVDAMFARRGYPEEKSQDSRSDKRRGRKGK